MNIDNIVISQIEPLKTNVLWIKPCNRSSQINVYENGKWKNLLDISQQLQITVDPSTQKLSQTWNLHKGTNWISTYLDIKLDDLKTALNSGSIISHKNGFVSYVNGIGWTGKLNSLNPAESYHIKVNQDMTITVTGDLLDIENLEYDILKGDNWISNPYEHPVEIAYAMQNFQSNEGDEIIDEYNNSAKYSEGYWQGELQVLMPGRGYIYRAQQDLAGAKNIQDESKKVVKNVLFIDDKLNISYTDVDSEVTEDSKNLITSGAVYNYIQSILNAQ